MQPYEHFDLVNQAGDPSGERRLIFVRNEGAKVMNDRMSAFIFCVEVIEDDKKN